MTDADILESLGVGAVDDGHCKDVDHVKVILTNAAPTAGSIIATYVATTTCVNVPDYHAWVVQLSHVVSGKTVPGLRMLPGLAEVFPAWLRRARKKALAQPGMNIAIQHTFNQELRTYAVIVPADAKTLARNVMRELEKAPLAA